MIRRIRSTLWVLLCVLGACAGVRCDGSKRSAPQDVAAVQAPRPDLRLLIATDPMGYLEPCGCQLRPLGGLDKLATAVAAQRKDGVPTLLLAAGDLAFGTELRPEDADEAKAQEVLRAETFAEVYKRLGFAAVAPGPLDLAQEPGLRNKLITASGFPWLVDNAAADDKALGKARIIETQGVKVGVMGLVAASSIHPAQGVALDDDLAARAAAQSKALREQGAQLVIALVSADRRTARTIAGRGVDVVVMGGLNLEHALPPAVVGDSVLLSAGYQGQHLLTVDLGLGSGGEWEDTSAWTRREAKKLSEKQIAAQRARIAEWEKDPKVAKADLGVQKDRLAELERAHAATAPPRFKKRWFRAELAPLAPEVQGDATIGSLIDEHDKRVNEHNRVALADLKPRPAEAGKPSYAGSESCASCHKEAFAWWQRTKHGNAYATLERTHKEFNLNCVSCHVTGYNQPGGSTVTHVGTAGALKNVGCESCHGPGSSHNAAPDKPGLIARAVPETTCVGCHTHEHSDRFVYDAFKMMLMVPGHGRPSDRQ